MYFARRSGPPFTVASKASVALRSLVFSDSFSASEFPFFGFGITSHFCFLTGLNIQTNQNAFGVGEISDDLSDRLREFSHERGDRQDLIAARERWVFHQVDDLDMVFTFQVRFANVFEV